MPSTQESEILLDKLFSEGKIKSLDDLSYDLEEAHFFVQKSNLAIFRFEDVIFSVFPHLAALKRKGANIIDIFKETDPFAKSNNPIDNMTAAHEKTGIRESDEIHTHSRFNAFR
jgi:hypothetical protein